MKGLEQDDLKLSSASDSLSSPEKVLSFLICEVGALLGKKNKSRELEAFPGLYIKRLRFRDDWRHLAAPRASRYGVSSRKQDQVTCPGELVSV